MQPWEELWLFRSKSSPCLQRQVCTSVTRQRKLLHSKHIPTQNDCVMLRRDCGQVLHVQQDSLRTRRETESHCCCWRLETSTAFKQKQSRHCKYTQHIIFFPSALASCVPHIAFIVWLKRTVPLDFEQLRTLGAVYQTKWLVHYLLRFSSCGWMISGRPILAQPWVIWLVSVPCAARRHCSLRCGSHHLGLCHLYWMVAVLHGGSSLVWVPPGGSSAGWDNANTGLAHEHKDITYKCTQQQGHSLAGARCPHHTWIQIDLKGAEMICWARRRKRRGIRGRVLILHWLQYLTYLL